MSTSNPVDNAVRFAVDHAVKPVFGSMDGTWSTANVAFGADARERLQRVLTSTGRLADAADACLAEMSRRVELGDMAGALAAIALSENLGVICPPRKRYGIDRDGILGALDA